MTGEILDARDRFPGADVPTAVLMTSADVAELERLRELERLLHERRSGAELFTELARLRILAHEASTVADKLAEHELCGYGRIKVGAFAGLRAAVAAWRKGGSRA